MDDLISRQAAVEAAVKMFEAWYGGSVLRDREIRARFDSLPHAQPEQANCEYCHEDSDGYVLSIEKNSHAWLVRRGRTMKLRIGFKGAYRECDILYCPMCGRRLTDG